MIKIEMHFASMDEAAEAMMKMAGGYNLDIQSATLAPSTIEAGLEAAQAGDAGKPRRTRRTAAQAAEATVAAPSTEQSEEPAAATEAKSEAAGSATTASSSDAKPALSAEEAAAKFVEVRGAMSKLMGKVGSDNARQFLATFQGVELAKSKLSDTPVDRYQDLIDACAAKLAE